MGYIVKFTGIILLVFLLTSKHTTATQLNLPKEEIKLGILTYLFYTKDKKIKNDINRIISDLSLNKNQIDIIKEIANYEAKKIYEIKNTYYLKRNQNDEYKDKKNIKSLKTSLIKGLISKINEKLYARLEDNKVNKLISYINSWYKSEETYRMKIRKSIKNLTPLGVHSCYVYATQFEPINRDEIGVAIPDKYVKFANLGWNIPSDYIDWYDNPPYILGVLLDGHRENFRVIDVGPWNEDDNYWDLPEWLNIGDGPFRRRFDILSICMPEAMAAFNEDFNDGLDQFGREVLNPAGIDLSIEAAKKLGLEYLENAWVTIYIDELP
ncbi:MAG: hypothetical protein SVN78_07475 [Deferribacterota bacterium]|nr:hypothetical protein [Deferribacterota bacterium]